jgi:ubiquinone biosynthesis protein COQ4
MLPREEDDMRKELSALGLRTPWAVLRGLRNFARTVWDPTRSDIRQGINSLVYGALREAGPEQLQKVERENRALAALWAERYDPPLDPGRLEQLPDGTLGREYLRFIRENRIDPLAELLEMDAPGNLLEYRFRRAYKLHDVLHVVLGCDASILGEVRIVAYSLGQARDSGLRAPALALVVLLLHLVLRRVEDFKEAVALAPEWMRLGARARPYASFRLEDLVERPVSEVRELVMAPAVPGEAAAPLGSATLAACSSGSSA